MSHGGGHPYSEPGPSAVPFTKSEGSAKYEGDGGFRVMEMLEMLSAAQASIIPMVKL
jgi:hypothetical protein